jgi:predicted NAD/FAD-binding protein
LGKSRYDLQQRFFLITDLSKLSPVVQELGVHTEPSDMSFAVSLAGRTFEWSSGGLAALFGSRGNVTNPSFYSMLADMTRFNKEAPQYLERCKAAPDDPASALSMEEYLRANGFGAPFRNWYLIPQIAAVWSASSADVLRFPARTFIQFCVNHSLLQVRGMDAAAHPESNVLCVAFRSHPLSPAALHPTAGA